MQEYHFLSKNSLFPAVQEFPFPSNTIIPICQQCNNSLYNGNRFVFAWLKQKSPGCFDLVYLFVSLTRFYNSRHIITGGMIDSIFCIKLKRICAYLDLMFTKANSQHLWLSVNGSTRGHVLVTFSHWFSTNSTRKQVKKCCVLFLKVPFPSKHPAPFHCQQLCMCGAVSTRGLSWGQVKLFKMAGFENFVAPTKLEF